MFYTNTIQPSPYTVFIHREISMNAQHSNAKNFINYFYFIRITDKGFIINESNIMQELISSIVHALTFRIMHWDLPMCRKHIYGLKLFASIVLVMVGLIIFFIDTSEPSCRLQIALGIMYIICFLYLICQIRLLASELCFRLLQLKNFMIQYDVHISSDRQNVYKLSKNLGPTIRFRDQNNRRDPRALVIDNNEEANTKDTGQNDHLQQTLPKWKRLPAVATSDHNSQSSIFPRPLKTNAKWIDNEKSYVWNGSLFFTLASFWSPDDCTDVCFTSPSPTLKLLPSYVTQVIVAASDANDRASYRPRCFMFRI